MLRHLIALTLALSPTPALAQGGPTTPLWDTEIGAIPPQELPASLPSLSAQACNACHGEVHEQWAASGHGRASTSPLYRASMDAMDEPELCRECHLPLAVQRPDVPQGPSHRRVSNPTFDATLSLEGVTCVACHVRDGQVLGPRRIAAEDAPHPVTRHDAFRGVGACAACHQLTLPDAEDGPFIDTVGEWSRSAWGQAGVPCQDCHMQRRSGAIAGSRYAAYSGHDLLSGQQALARAITLQVDVRAAHLVRGEELRATATLMNTGAGHSVPTGLPDKALELRFEVLDAEGQILSGFEPRSHWLRRVVEDELPYALVSDDRLASGASRAFDLAWRVPNKLKAPGRLWLRTSVWRWKAPLDKATALGLQAVDVSELVTEQRLPLRFE